MQDSCELRMYFRKLDFIFQIIKTMPYLLINILMQTYSWN